ncbi:hypothetical protein BDQ17DRAFT_1363330 [Cyathus striatus]|nr:hypothetical protein BDQ17DRAFT_1363330 [Cyathus striatus]
MHSFSPLLHSPLPRLSSSFVRFITPRQLRVFSSPPTPSTAPERIKRPTQGGNNLSDRYCTLQQSLRGKQAHSNDIVQLLRRNTT